MLHAVIEPIKGIVEWQGRIPAEAENVFHAMGLEQAHHGLGAGQFVATSLHHRRHLVLPTLKMNTFMYTILDFFTKSVNAIPIYLGDFELLNFSSCLSLEVCIQFGRLDLLYE
jgi:hypothetical protein